MWGRVYVGSGFLSCRNTFKIISLHIRGKIVSILLRLGTGVAIGSWFVCGTAVGRVGSLSFKNHNIYFHYLDWVYGPFFFKFGRYSNRSWHWVIDPSRYTRWRSSIWWFDSLSNWRQVSILNIILKIHFILPELDNWLSIVAVLNQSLEHKYRDRLYQSIGWLIAHSSIQDSKYRWWWGWFFQWSYSRPQMIFDRNSRPNSRPERITPDAMRRLKKSSRLCWDFIGTWNCNHQVPNQVDSRWCSVEYRTSEYLHSTCR